MYGLVNRAIKDLVVSTSSVEVWDKIRASANFNEEDFLDSAPYADEITFKLIAAASEELNIPAEKILFEFGRHWILYTGREGWASVFYLTGDTMKEFLEGLDGMHARVQIAMPECNMPQFSVFEHEDHLVLEYHSDREGLAPMVLGLLDGLAEQFSEQWQVEHIEHRRDKGFDSFCLRKIESVRATNTLIAA